MKEIEEDFLTFFPELMAYVAEDLDGELLGHWLKGYDITQ